MIIETRYRDLPWEEVKKCQPRARPRFWASVRGKPVRIIAGPVEKRHPAILCDGPFYMCADKYLLVCPHIAEIGD